MKRYTHEDITKEETLELLSKMGIVQEIVGYTARIDIDGRLLEIPTSGWTELKEAE